MSRCNCAAAGCPDKGFARGEKPAYDTVCFASSFARESSPNITHITIDGEKTLCGRRDWMTTEGWRPDLVACARCSHAYERLGRPHWSDMDASVLETVGS